MTRHSRPPRLRVLGTHEILIEPIRRQAESDLGIIVEDQVADSMDAVRRAVTAPDAFDVYHQWHTVDLVWSSRSIQPIDLSRIVGWSEIALLAKHGPRSDGRSSGAGPRGKLFLQKDDTLHSDPSNRASMVPTLHGVDAPGFIRSVRNGIVGQEPESWSWLLDDRWHGKVALASDPSMGIIEAALALESSGHLKFGDIGNLEEEEIDSIVSILIRKKKIGHFRGFWSYGEEAERLMSRGGVCLQSIWSPSVFRLRQIGVDVVCSAPVEGYRGWYAGLCLSSRVSGTVLEAAYAYLNWWLSGKPGAVLSRQGYYATTPQRARSYLAEKEWNFWYAGEAAATDLVDPFGGICVRAGDIRDGGSYERRMSHVRVWNSFMDEQNYLVRRWREFLNA
jgi:putative spermidine/putrescine transport system substrate-binding protein